MYMKYLIHNSHSKWMLYSPIWSCLFPENHATMIPKIKFLCNCFVLKLGKGKKPKSKTPQCFPIQSSEMRVLNVNIKTCTFESWDLIKIG